MNKSLKLYKSIVDELSQIHDGVYEKWVKETGWPKIKDNAGVNKLLDKLSFEEKEILSKELISARNGGIHDTLVHLNDRMNLEGLRFVEEDIKASHEPFGTTLYYDWLCRKEGDAWPDED